MIRYVFFLLFCFGTASAGLSQENWKLATDQDGIRVFIKSVEHTDLKMLRVECELKSRQEAVVALLLDLSATPKWIPQTKSWRYLRKLSETEFYYHSEIRLPWPVWNRDFVIHVQFSQHPVSKVVTVDAKAVTGEVPEKEGVVRVTTSNVSWTLQPLTNGHTRLIYQLYTDPGGSLPVSVVNYFAKDAAVDIIKKMQEMIQQPPYSNASLAFLLK